MSVNLDDALDSKKRTSGVIGFLHLGAGYFLINCSHLSVVIAPWIRNPPKQ
jgi:hypothetical protein